MRIQEGEGKLMVGGGREWVRQREQKDVQLKNEVRCCMTLWKDTKKVLAIPSRCTQHTHTHYMSLSAELSDTGYRPLTAAAVASSAAALSMSRCASCSVRH